jgi:hypothetical protein
MLKTIAKLEKQIGDKIYTFLLDSDSQISHAKEALLQFLGYVTQVEENAKAQQAAQAASQETAPPEAIVENKQENVSN